MADYRAPEKIDCDEHCDVPPGVTLSEVPPSRHKWNDILVCPNCGKQFLLISDKQKATELVD